MLAALAEVPEVVRDLTNSVLLRFRFPLSGMIRIRSGNFARFMFHGKIESIGISRHLFFP